MLQDVTAPKTPPSALEQFNIRMSRDLIDALDEIVEEERGAKPGRTYSRSDLIREMLYEALAARRASRPVKKR